MGLGWRWTDQQKRVNQAQPEDLRLTGAAEAREKTAETPAKTMEIGCQSGKQPRKGGAVGVLGREGYSRKGGRYAFFSDFEPRHV